MSHILYIDTSSSITTVACTVNGIVSSYLINEAKNEQASVINNLIEKSLAEAKVSLSSLSAIALCSGPGSYTGLRVGFSCAKGLCFAADIPLVITDRFTLINRQYAIQNKTNLIALKARVGEYFVAAYNEAGIEVLSPSILLTHELIEQITNLQAHVICDDANFLATLAVAPAATQIIVNFKPDISVWQKIASKNIADKAFADLAYCEPLYIKQAFTTVSKKKLI